MKYVVWGSRAAGQFIARMAERVGHEIAAYCSSSQFSQEKQIRGIPVISPEELAQLYREKKIDGVLLGIQNPVYLKEIEITISELFPSDFSFVSRDAIEKAYLEAEHEHMQYRWDVAFEKQAEIWLQNFMGEVRDWVRDDVSPAGVYHQSYLERLENVDFLGIDDTCGELSQALHAGSVVMDVGCGLVSMYGTRLPSSEHVQLLAVDPLAPFYNLINQKYAGGKKTCRFGLFEFMADFYKENYSDLILINNALDHCIDPYKSIIECLYVLKRNGILRLRHRRAEAVYEAYQGFHKWNIDYNRQNELIFWNQENAVNVSQRLKEIADIKVLPVDENAPRNSQYLVAEVRKKNDFSLDAFLDSSQEQRQLAFLVEGLMGWIAGHNADDYLGFV